MGQHDDRVGVGRSQPEVVQHDDDGVAACGALTGQTEHQLLVADVERRGGLVEQQREGLLGQHSRERGA